MKIRKPGATEEKIELNMTSMIDIVFQLLIFFIMTFKIVTEEGDFNIKMPLQSQASGEMLEELVPPIEIEMTAYKLGAGNPGDGRIDTATVTIGDNVVRVKFPPFPADVSSAYPKSQADRDKIRDYEDQRRAIFGKVRDAVIDYIGDDRGPSSKQANTEVELDCDYNLKYIEVVEAITQVSGYIDNDGNLVKLIEKIKLRPQPKTQGG